jgi:hypothetical protein
MTKGKIPNINNKLHGSELVTVTANSTGSLGFDEFNAVLNNVNASVLSNNIMKANYDLNAKTPTNFSNLISGSADKFEIQDDRYKSLSFLSPRYLGSKTISANYNNYQPSGSLVLFVDNEVGAWDGDQTFNSIPGLEIFHRGNPLGKLTAIDLYSTHFVLFDKIEINSSLFNRDVFHCLYIIDDMGNKLPLSYKNKNLVTLQRLFKPGSNSEVIFLGANNQELLDNYPIERVGIVSKDNIVISNDLFIKDTNNALFSLADTSQAVGLSLFDNGVATSQFTFSYNKYGNTENSIPNAVNYRSVRLAPSLFSASLVSSNPNTYKLTYSTSGSRASLIDDGNYLSISNNHILRVSGSSQFLYHFNYLTSSVPTYLGSPLATLLDTTGTLLAYASSSYLNPSPYTFNENSLDPFYILTYNSQNHKVFEGTVYETIINDAKFESINPYQVINNGAVGYSNKALPNTTLSNLTSMTPQSSMTQSTPLKEGDFLEFGTFNINGYIDSSLVDQNDPYQSIKDNLPITKLVTTRVKSIELPGTFSDYLLKYDGYFGTGPNQGTWGCIGTTAKFPIGGTYQPLTFIDLWYKPSWPPLNNPTGVEICLSHFSGSFVSLVNEPIESQPPIPDPYWITGYASNDAPWIWCSGSIGAEYNPVWNHESFSPGDMYGIILNKSTSGYVDYTAFGGPLNKLTHGDIIEFCLLSDFGPSNSYNNNQPLPDSKIWRYMVSKPGEQNPFGGNSIGFDAYKFYLTYLNGHNSDPIPYSAGFYNTAGTGIPSYPNWNYPSDAFVIYQIRKQTSTPSITVEVTAGNVDLNQLLKNSGSIMTKSDVKQHEQYIESQYLQGTGVGVLLPEDYDPKLREKLSDIINKTNIDISNLI